MEMSTTVCVVGCNTCISKYIAREHFSTQSDLVYGEAKGMSADSEALTVSKGTKVCSQGIVFYNARIACMRCRISHKQWF